MEHRGGRDSMRDNDRENRSGTCPGKGERSMRKTGRSEGDRIVYGRLLIIIAAFLLLCAGAALQARAANLTGLTVVGVERVYDPALCPSGVAPCSIETPVTDHRSLVEEDRTYHVGFEGDGDTTVHPT